MNGRNLQKRWAQWIKKGNMKNVVVTELVKITINACYELLEKHSFFVGGSSGAVLAGIKKFFREKPLDRPVNIVSVFPDRGERYYDTIYNKEWCDNIVKFKLSEKEKSLAGISL